MPAKFLLSRFSQKGKQFLSVRVEEFAIFPCRFFCHVCQSHSDDGIRIPHSGNQLLKQFRTLFHHCSNRIGAANRPPVASLQKISDLISAHTNHAVALNYCATIAAVLSDSSGDGSPPMRLSRISIISKIARLFCAATFFLNSASLAGSNICFTPPTTSSKLFKTT